MSQLRVWSLAKLRWVISLLRRVRSTQFHLMWNCRRVCNWTRRRRCLPQRGSPLPAKRKIWSEESRRLTTLLRGVTTEDRRLLRRLASSLSGVTRGRHPSSLMSFLLLSRTGVLSGSRTSQTTAIVSRGTLRHAKGTAIVILTRNHRLETTYVPSLNVVARMLVVVKQEAADILTLVQCRLLDVTSQPISPGINVFGWVECRLTGADLTRCVLLQCYICSSEDRSCRTLYLDKFVRGVYFTTPSVVFLWVQSRFAETRFAEMPILTLTLNPNFGETGFGESGFGKSGRHQPLTLISANRVSAKREDTDRHRYMSDQTHTLYRCFGRMIFPIRWQWLEAWKMVACRHIAYWCSWLVSSDSPFNNLRNKRKVANRSKVVHDRWIQTWIWSGVTIACFSETGSRPWVLSDALAILVMYGRSTYWYTNLTFSGQVMSSVTWSFDSP